MKPAKTCLVLFAALSMSWAASAALADANCGNPCNDNEYWTDKQGGKCLPKPETKSEPKTS